MPPTRAFLDTTVQIDRKKSGAREQVIEQVVAGYDWVFGTSISQLEFKAVLVQECVTIHNELVREGRFTRVRDRLIESQHPQARLRAHIFNNLIALWGSSHRIDEEQDADLARQARLNLELIIPDLYTWFTENAVDGILGDRVNCTRAAEAPVKKKHAFDNSMPVCSRKRGNKSCTVEQAIRAHAPGLLEKLRPLLTGDAERDKQITRSIEVFEGVFADPAADLSHRDCRRCGDCLMALEAVGNVTHFVSTNVNEWERLATAAGVEFRRVTYDAGPGA